MGTLTQLIEQIQTEFKVSPEGRAFVSIRGAARLADVSEQVLSRAFQADNVLTSKLAQSLQNKGFTVTTFSSGIPDMALGVILEYYAFDAGKRCTDQAKLAYRAFAAIGIRAWIQEICGYPGQLKPLTLAKRAEIVTELSTAIQNLKIDTQNPRIKEGLQGVACGILGIGVQSLPDDEWVTIADKAKRMGYAPGRISRIRCGLGRHVSHQSNDFGLQRRKEDRSDNGNGGRRQEVWVYLDCPELEVLIQDFMDTRA